MPRELTATVYLGTGTEVTTVLAAGTPESDLSAEVRKQITNPSAWRDTTPTAPEPDKPKK